MKHVLLDVDGVVMDLVGTTHFTMRRIYREMHLPEPSITDLSDYSMKSLYSPEMHFLVPVLWATPGFALRMKLTSFGVELCGLNYQKRRAALNMGFTCEFVTSPYDPSPTWIADRTTRFDQQFPGIKINFDHDKSHYNGDIFVDDRIDHLASWKEKHPTGDAYLVKTRYTDFLLQEFADETGCPKDFVLKETGVRPIQLSKLMGVLQK